MITKPECYGTMFPDLSTDVFNTPHEGKAFTLLVRSSGFGVTERESSVKMDEWEACIACPAYDTCYALCMAKLALHQAAHSYGIARNV